MASIPIVSLDRDDSEGVSRIIVETEATSRVLVGLVVAACLAYRFGWIGMLAISAAVIATVAT